MQNKPAFYRIFFKPNRMLATWMICITQVLFSFSSFSQDSSAYATVKDRLVKVLNKRFIDKAYTESIDRFYYTTCDSLIKQDVVIEDQPIRDILLKLFVVCEEKLNTGSITSLRIPAVNNYFLSTIQIYKKQPINKLYREIGVMQTTILQSAFDGLLLGDSIKTFAGLRDMLNFPFTILTRIDLPRYARYKDTLLYYLANDAPDILEEKLAENDSLYTALVSNSHNRTVKVVSLLKEEKDLNKFLPFGLAILENRISADKIKELSLWPREYYHAFVEEVLRLHKSNDPVVSSYMKRPIAAINKYLANRYFINDINMQHEFPDKLRFETISTLPAKDLYFLIIGGSNDLYTSSFLYIYKKLLEETEKEGLDKFFDAIGYYQFDQFLSNISVYGLVEDLVGQIREKKFAGLVGKYLVNLQNTQLKDNEIILNAMTLSEVLYAIRNYPDLKTPLINELDNIENPNVQNDILLQRMYMGFKDILLDKNEYNTDETYNVLPIDRLKKNGAIVQVWFFYDDEDAASSFAGGIAEFDKKTWNKTDTGNYIVFSSREGNSMKVYMNKPNTEVGYEAAQNEMMQAIKQEGYEVTSFIHRGHSYYLYHSLTLMTPSAQFVFLGSCGGTNEVLKVFEINPDVNVIVTRHLGAKLINDQLLARINREIIDNRDLNWDTLWEEFNRMFQSKLEKDLFSSYIPPNKYIGVKFIRKVFNY